MSNEYASISLSLTSYQSYRSILSNRELLVSVLLTFMLKNITVITVIDDSMTSVWLILNKSAIFEKLVFMKITFPLANTSSGRSKKDESMKSHAMPQQLLLSTGPFCLHIITSWSTCVRYNGEGWGCVWMVLPQVVCFHTFHLPKKTIYKENFFL